MSEPPGTKAACSDLYTHSALDLRLSYVPDEVGVNKTGVKIILLSERRG
jgi:hypothetical protein